MNEKSKDTAPAITFEWHSLVSDLIDNIFIIIIAAFIGLMGVYIAAQTVYSPVYESTATITVRSSTGSGDAYNDLSGSAAMTKIYVDVFTQKAMKDSAAAALGRDKFNGTIKAAALTDTNIMTITVGADSPEEAYRLIRAVIDVCPRIANSVFSNAIIDIVRYPTMPKAPSNGVTFGFAVAVVVLAMAAVTACVVMLSLFRDTVKDEASYNSKVGAKLLGIVAHEIKYRTVREMLEKKKKALLINNAFASYRFSESFRRIAAKLEYSKRVGGSSVFMITSVAENEGKSTAAVNIALALADRGHKVMLLDMDFKKPALHKVLDLTVAPDADWGGFVSGEIPSSAYKFTPYRKSNVFTALNANSHPECADMLGSERVKNSITALCRLFDFIIIDTPPMSVADDTVAILPMADRAILVVRTDRALTADINDAVYALSDTSLAGTAQGTGSNPEEKFVGCILNDIFLSTGSGRTSGSGDQDSREIQMKRRVQE